MANIGYARVSSGDQSLDVQLDQLREAGVEKVFSEKQSGTTTAKREELTRCLEFVREGDVLVITRLDRLARSIVDLRGIIDLLEAKGVGFRVIHQPIDTTTAAGRLMLTILGAFAEFETDIRRERQMEGIKKARDAGVYTKRAPRKKKVDPDEIRRLRDEEGLGATAIGRRLEVNKTTVYRAVPDGWGTAAPADVG